MTVPAPDPAELRERAAALRSELPGSAAEADAGNADSAHGMRRIWEEGLLSYNLLREHGGVTDGSPTVRTEDYFSLLVDLTAGDSSAGMNYGVQNLVTLEIFARDNGLPRATKDEIARRVISEGTRLVASNAETGSPRPVSARRAGGGIIVSGTKTFNTNSGGGGIANASITIDGEEGRWHVLIPLDSGGVVCRHDWDVMGQRGTYSQTIDYNDVFVPDGWYYRSHGFSAQMAPYVFLLHSAIMLGPGYGALDAARAYLLHAARRLEHWDDAPPDPTEIFDLTGARGTAARYRFDRFWRNARTFSTHDPTDAKEVWIGDWYLSGKEPPFFAMLRV